MVKFMPRIVSRITFVAGVTSIICALLPTRIQGDQNQVHWQWRYLGGVLPDDATGSLIGPDGTKHTFHQLGKGTPPRVSISATKTLLYRDEESNQQRYFVGTPGRLAGTSLWNAAHGPGSTIEIRLRVLVGAGPGTAAGIRASTGKHVYGVRFRTDGLEDLGFGDSTNAFGFDLSSDFATIRYVLPPDGGAGWAQLVDANGKVGQTRMEPLQVEASNSLQFSSGGSDDPPRHTQWEIKSIAWTNQGAFPADLQQWAKEAQQTVADKVKREREARATVLSSVEPMRLGTHRQLFVDDYLIEEQHAIRRHIHQAVKYAGNPVVRGENPWDGGRAYVYGSVEKHPESGKLRLWYMSAYKPTHTDWKVAINQCLAESHDGIRWSYPNLGLIPYDGPDGSKDNNMVFSTNTHSGYDECLTPIRDPSSADPQKRYRSLFWASHNGYRGTYSAWSPDGVKWFSSETPSFTDTGDAGSIMYDSIQNRWIFLARPLDNQLSRAVSFSEDFETWTPLKVIFQADKSKREDFYNMAGFCYEGLYLGLVVIMWEEPGRYALEPHLVMSRDGQDWQWLDRQNAFIPHGPRGSWEEFNTQMAAGPPVRVGNQLYFYYSGRTYPHGPYYARNQTEIIPEQLVESDVNVGLATLRVDGLRHWRTFGEGAGSRRNRSCARVRHCTLISTARMASCA